MAVNYLNHMPAACVFAVGDDAARFLQSQFSNDLQKHGERPCVYGLWLDRKGRIVADSHILGLRPMEFLLFSHTSPARTIIDKLQAFIVADDVELEDRSSRFAVTTLWGDGTEALLRAWGFRLPREGGFVEQGGIHLFRDRRMRGECYELLYPEDASDWVLRRVSEPANGHTPRKASEAAAEAERILAGVPSIPRDCAGETLPQELGLDVNAVSFDKGCYLGQEVMSRVRQTGRHTREMRRLRLSGNPGSLPAAVVDDGETEPVGQLTSAAQADDGTWVGLATLRRKVIDKLPEHLRAGSATAVLEKA